MSKHKSISCTKCGEKIFFDPKGEGKTIECPECGTSNKNSHFTESKFEKFLIESKTVTIEKADGEYRVPAEDGYENGAAYTDDKEDAIGIAKKVFGSDVIIKFRSVPEFVGGKYSKYKPRS